ncbi:MAG: helix-turn-helix domain-containing protein [Caulobacterales bacterium]
MAGGAKGPAAPKQRRTQQERTAVARAKLMDAAIELIAEKGFHNTTLADIATRADFTRGAIQHHFASRTELVFAILLDVEAKVKQSFEVSVANMNVPLARRLDTLIDNLREVSRSDYYLAVLDIWTSTASDPALRDAVRHSMRRATQDYRGYWQHVFGDEVPADVIKDCRRLVVMFFRGLTVTRIFARDIKEMDSTTETLKVMVRNYMLTNAMIKSQKRVRTQ